MPIGRYRWRDSGVPNVPYGSYGVPSKCELIRKSTSSTLTLRSGSRHHGMSSEVGVYRAFGESQSSLGFRYRCMYQARGVL